MISAIWAAAASAHVMNATAGIGKGNGQFGRNEKHI